MKEDDIFGNDVVSDDDDDGNNTRGGDDEQFATARTDALGSWPGESSSTAAAACSETPAAAGESRDSSHKRAKFYADFE